MATPIVLTNGQRRIITLNKKRWLDAHTSGLLMSILYHGKTMALSIYIPRDICATFPTFEQDRSRFHIAEGMAEDDCLYLIPHADGLVAHRTKVGRNILHLNLGYLESYKIVWPEGARENTPITATPVKHEVTNGEIKVLCPEWMVRVT
jgi:hypothetical protein